MLTNVTNVATTMSHLALLMPQHVANVLETAIHFLACRESFCKDCVLNYFIT